MSLHIHPSSLLHVLKNSCICASPRTVRGGHLYRYLRSTCGPQPICSSWLSVQWTQNNSDWPCLLVDTVHKKRFDLVIEWPENVVRLRSRWVPEANQACLQARAYGNSHMCPAWQPALLSRRPVARLQIWDQVPARLAQPVSLGRRLADARFISLSLFSEFRILLQRFGRWFAHFYWSQVQSPLLVTLCSGAITYRIKGCNFTTTQCTTLAF